jgi:transposase-like protein
VPLFFHDPLVLHEAFRRAVLAAFVKEGKTTNPIERVNLEFRRRTKTQGSFPNEDSALVLLYGLVAMEQIQFRRIDGWRELPKVLAMGLAKVA